MKSEGTESQELDGILGNGEIADQDIADGQDGNFDESGADSDGVIKRLNPANRSALVLFVIMVLGFAGMWFFFMRTGPREAQAAAPSPQLTAAQSIISQFLADGQRNVSKMRVLLLNTQAVVSQFQSYPNAVQIPLEGLRVNPFRFLSARAAPKEESANVSARRKEEERVAFLKLVQALEIESIMRSDKVRACMINNKLYQEGQQIGALTVEKINQNGIIVNNGAYRAEVRMQQ